MTSFHNNNKLIFRLNMEQVHIINLIDRGEYYAVYIIRNSFISQHESAWWFIFRENELLVRLTDEHGQIPKISQPEQLSLHVLRTQYLASVMEFLFPAEAETQNRLHLRGWHFGPCVRCIMLPDELFLIAGRAFQIMD